MIRMLLLSLAAVHLLHAAVVVEFQPQSQVVTVGDMVSVDVIITGLNSPAVVLGGYALAVNFDPAILMPEAVPVDFNSIELGDPNASPATAFAAASEPALNLLRFTEVSNLQPGELAALQLNEAEFRLATISFDATAEGTSALAWNVMFPFLTDNFGRTLPATLADGEITVVIPEPASFIATILAASVGLVARRLIRAEAP